MEMLQEYVVVIVLGICLGLGFIIKHSLDFIPNKYIPLILGLAGVGLNTSTNRRNLKRLELWRWLK